MLSNEVWGPSMRACLLVNRKTKNNKDAKLKL